METLVQNVGAGVLESLSAFLNPAERVYWPYLLSSVLLAALVLRLGGQYSAPATGSSLATSWRHPSARLDIKLFLSNACLDALWSMPWSLTALGMAIAWVGCLESLWPRPTPLAWSQGSITALYTVTLFVAWDLSRYLLHRCMHRFPLLWAFHKVHHSAETLTPMTLYRTHPVERLLYALRGSLTTALITGSFFYLFGRQALAYEFFGVHAAGFCFNLLGANLRHSHIWLSYGPFFERLFISPAQHQIHHSAAEIHRDKNFGTWLALWDRWGDSLVVADQTPVQHFGLQEETAHSLRRALGLPFFESIRALERVLKRRVS